MTDRAVLTVDLGTSGPKAAVVAESGAVLGSARARVATDFGPRGAAEQDAEAVWTATQDACRGAMADAGGRAATSIVAVAASAQYSSIIPARRDGTPVGPMVVWLDQRTSPRRLQRLPNATRRDRWPDHLIWLRHHGLPPVESGMALNAMRFLEWGGAHPDTEVYLEPVDYLTARLTGRSTANQCSAFMMLLTDNRTVPAAAWDPSLLRRSGIAAERLPEFVPVGSVVGTVRPEVADSIGLGRDVPVLAGINDTQAGAVAAGALTPDGPAGLSLGTSSVIVAHAAAKKADVRHTLFTMPAPLGDGHLLSAENGVAGVAVDWFLDRVVDADDALAARPDDDDRYRALGAAAASSPSGANGAMFLPWLRGSLAPKADGRVRGGFVNLGLDSTRADLARAIFEGVAHNLRWLRSPVERFLDRPLERLVFYGGGAASDLWAQTMADVVGLPVSQLERAGFANSVGTAMYALHHLGALDARAAAATLPVRRTYEPDGTTAEGHAARAEAFAEFFSRNRSVYRLLAARR